MKNWRRHRKNMLFWYMSTHKTYFKPLHNVNSYQVLNQFDIKQGSLRNIACPSNCLFNFNYIHFEMNWFWFTKLEFLSRVGKSIIASWSWIRPNTYAMIKRGKIVENYKCIGQSLKCNLNIFLKHKRRNVNPIGPENAAF